MSDFDLPYIVYSTHKQRIYHNLARGPLCSIYQFLYMYNTDRENLQEDENFGFLIELVHVQYFPGLAPKVHVNPLYLIMRFTVITKS